MSDQGRSAWVTVVTPVDDLAAVRDELAERLGAAPRVETSRDALLSPGGGWYRTALQRVTHVGLDVLEARERLPLSEYEAFERPSESALPLLAFLSGASETYRRTCPTYESAEAFWLDFFRRAPAPELPRAGRWLWNLAG